MTQSRIVTNEIPALLLGARNDKNYLIHTFLICVRYKEGIPVFILE